MTRACTVLIVLGLLLAVLPVLSPTAAEAQTADFVVNGSIVGTTCPTLTAGSLSITGTFTSSPPGCTFSIGNRSYTDLNGHPIFIRTGTIAFSERVDGLADSIRLNGVRIGTASTVGDNTFVPNIKIRFSRQFKSHGAVTSTEVLSFRTSGNWVCTGGSFGTTCPSNVSSDPVIGPYTSKVTATGTGTTCLGGNCNSISPSPAVSRVRTAFQTSTSADSVSLSQLKTTVKASVPRSTDTNLGTGELLIDQLPGGLELTMTAEVHITDINSAPFSGTPTSCDGKAEDQITPSEEDYGNIVRGDTADLDRICCKVPLQDTCPVEFEAELLTGAQCLSVTQALAQDLGFPIGPNPANCSAGPKK